jgi:tetratricopeptide (TPR) repeat protein
MVGQAERAIELAALRFDLCRDAADLRGQALSKGVLGDAYHALGQYGNAVAAYSEALPLLRDHAIRRHYALCLFKLGCALAAMGDHKRAVSSLRESLPIFRELRLPAYEERAEQVLRESLR